MGRIGWSNRVKCILTLLSLVLYSASCSKFAKVDLQILLDASGVLEDETWNWSNFEELKKVSTIKLIDLLTF